VSVDALGERPVVLVIHGRVMELNRQVPAVQRLAQELFVGQFRNSLVLQIDRRAGLLFRFAVPLLGLLRDFDRLPFPPCPVRQDLPRELRLKLVALACTFQEIGHERANLG
jgi:hypothetical protein